MAGKQRRAWGELEDDVMQVLWAHDEALSVREVLGCFPDDTPAYTTMVTVLSRLTKKGMVVRIGESPRKNRFKAAHTVDEHVSSKMLSTLRGAPDRHDALLRFAGSLSPEDVAILRNAIEAGGDGSASR